MKSPYAKAIVSGLLGAVIVASTVLDHPYLAIAAAAVSPLAVFMAKNQ